MCVLYWREMKNDKMFFVGIIFTSLSYSMEQPLEAPAKPKICIKKGSIYDADGTVDIIVVGLREQQRLNRTFHLVDEKGDTIDTVGAVQFMKPHVAYVNIMKPEDDSDSKEETIYHPCEILKHKDYNYYQKNMNSRTLVVVEPKMRNTGYTNQREEYLYVKNQHVFYGEPALSAAKVDLFSCYNNILEKGLQELGDKKDKSIAIPTLSTSVGFPRNVAAITALATISAFVKNNPYAYSRIELFVKKHSEYNRYCRCFSGCKWFIKDKSAMQNNESIKENHGTVLFFYD